MADMSYYERCIGKDYTRLDCAKFGLPKIMIYIPRIPFSISFRVKADTTFYRLMGGVCQG